MDKGREKVRIFTGIKRENYYYTEQFPDLVDHNPYAQIREKGDWIFRYGIKASF